LEDTNEPRKESSAMPLPMNAGRSRPLSLPGRFARIAIAAAVAALAATGTGGAFAQAPAQPIAYDVPAGPLADALNRFALQAGVAIAIDANQLRGLRSGGLQGRHGVEEGFGVLLRGSGYVLARTPGGYVLRAAPPPAPQAAPAAVSPAAREIPRLRRPPCRRRCGTGCRTPAPRCAPKPSSPRTWRPTSAASGAASGAPA
jgi:iron complex outermembrane receptor protein